MGLHATGRHNAAFVAAAFGSGTHLHPLTDVRHEIVVAGLPDADHPPVLDSDIRLHDTPIIKSKRIRDHRVERAARAGRSRGLAHPVTEHFPSPEDSLIAVRGEILLDLNHQLRVGEPDPVSDRGTEHIRILFPWDFHRAPPFPENPSSAARERACAFTCASSNDPLVRPLIPWATRLPARATTVTRFSSPGSNRTAVPAGMLSRMPNAWARSKRSARLTSKKWKCEPTWIGRSPVFATVSSTVRRPAFATMSPSPSRYSPGITIAS